MSFILSCESTVDLPYEYIAGRNIPVLFYSYTVRGNEYADDMGRDPETLPQLYRFLKEGELPSTSQINVYRYKEFFRELLQKGDLLHISFGTGMTPSVKNADTAAKELKEEFPDRKIIVIDSLCSSSGYGMLVDVAADMRDNGESIEEVSKWVTENRNRVHHQFFSTDLTFFRKSGRMSGATAMIATVLDICPIMRLDDGGRIIAYGKVRGKKNAVRETVRVMEMYADGGKNYDQKCFICHSNCIENARDLEKAVLANFPNIKSIRICDIGTIIASHCGPGTTAVFFFGQERLSEEERKKLK